MKYPRINIVFDRKNVSSITVRALVCIEVSFQYRRKYFSTGVKIYKDQWDERLLVTKSNNAEELRKAIMMIYERVEKYVARLAQDGLPFDWEHFTAFMNMAQMENISFIDFVEKHIKERTDVRESTKERHRVLVKALKEFGGIMYFRDIKKSNIVLFDDFIHKKKGVRSEKMRAASVWTYHKLLKSYINEAIRREYINDNPYNYLRFSRGTEVMGEYLSIDEVRSLQEYIPRTIHLSYLRDLFLFQCYTGLAYGDMAEFSKEKVTFQQGHYVISSERVKTGEHYYVVMLDEAVEIAEKYDWKLPVVSNQKYNMGLKIIAAECGIRKNVTSHMGRRTCGMILLNSGISIEVVAKVLGHSDVKTTQKAYAKILNSTVDREMGNFIERMKGEKERL